MRLIDADRLETHEQLEPFGNGNYEYVEVVYKDDIDNAPTIESKRTGHWIVGEYDTVRGYWATCSSCGHISFGGGKFCRECGARMKEGDSDD